jgi:hypothetical protein
MRCGCESNIFVLGVSLQCSYIDVKAYNGRFYIGLLACCDVMLTGGLGLLMDQQTTGTSMRATGRPFDMAQLQWL